MNTLALDPGYAANFFQIRKMVADFRLIKVGDQSDWVEVYAVQVYELQRIAMRKFGRNAHPTARAS